MFFWLPRAGRGRRTDLSSIGILVLTPFYSVVHTSTRSNTGTWSSVKSNYFSYTYTLCWINFFWPLAQLPNLGVSFIFLHIVYTVKGHPRWTTSTS